ncbi:MAG: hypothetical protein P9L98_00665 [Candidatus Kaelpia imicola]|nr:hypothetical protein [Candidatus Kaelpia imicola]
MDFKEIFNIYRELNSSVRQKISALSLVVMAAIFVLIDKELGVKDSFVLYKLSFLCFVFSLFFEIINGLWASVHYAKYIDGKIESLDFRKSRWGVWTEKAFWAMCVCFLIGGVLFTISIFKLSLP